MNINSYSFITIKRFENMPSLYLNNEEIDELKNQINNKFAQKPSFKDRRIDFDEETPYYINRNAFSRDRDRIIFSKAFRRLEHKAQVYSHVKGDHYRTRLTHTIEVMQIARSITRNLGLNEDLTEAIALGHDIGHTPFGHQGEDVLDGIMRGKDDLGGNLKYRLNYCGFKHNFNGLRTVDILEKKYEKEKGLNLTWQVSEGILKHTKIEKNDIKWDIRRFTQCKKHIEDFMEYNHPVTLEGQIVAIADEIAQRQHDLDDGLRDNDLKLDEEKIRDYINESIEKIIAKTVKNISNFTDLDLKYHSKFISFLKYSKPKDVFKTEEGKIYLLKHRKGQLDYSAWDKLLMKLFIVNHVVPDNIEVKLLKELESKIENKKKFSDENYVWNSLIRDIIDYFIKDVTLNSLENLNNQLKVPKIDNFKLKLVNRNKVSCKKSNEKIQIGNKIFWNKRKYFDSILINFSESGSEFDQKIEDYIKNRILNSYNVNIFDGKAIYIVRQLFKAYYTNPRQMPKETLDKLSKRIHENTKWYGCKIVLANRYLDEIEFRNSPPNEIKELIKFLKLEMERAEIEKIFNDTYSNEILSLSYDFLRRIRGNFGNIKKKCEECDDDYDKKIIEMIFEKINSLTKNEIITKTDAELLEKMIFIKCVLEHHYAYLSIICDHIAGMTDNYANNEYRKLYLV